MICIAHQCKRNVNEILLIDRKLEVDSNWWFTCISSFWYCSNNSVTINYIGLKYAVWLKKKITRNSATSPWYALKFAQRVNDIRLVDFRWSWTQLLYDNLESTLTEFKIQFSWYSCCNQLIFWADFKVK